MPDRLPKVLLAAPGSGDAFYCGNCARDSAQAAALLRAGCDACVMPLYLPKCGAGAQESPLFFPAPSAYAAHRFFGGRTVPRALEKILDSAAAVKMASAMSAAGSASGMADMTISMIEGSGGHFERQAAKIARWVDACGRPDVAHISSSLMLGLAKFFKTRLGIPTVCSVQDEESWIDAMPEGARAAAWRAMERNFEFADLIVSPSDFYAQKLRARMPETAGKIRVAYPCAPQEATLCALPETPAVGFLFRACPESGLDILAGAFSILKASGKFGSLRLKIAGGSAAADFSFVRKIRRMLRPVEGSVDWAGPFLPGSVQEFFRSVSAVCVPVRFEEAAGMYLCEAFARGRPAAAPDTGSFPEIGGGACEFCRGNTPEALASAIGRLFSDEGLFKRRAAEAVRLAKTRYSPEAHAEALISVYREIA